MHDTNGEVFVISLKQPTNAAKTISDWFIKYQ